MGKKVEYIAFEEFVRISGFKEKTVKKNYKKIPGIEKKDGKYTVISGTRYPYNLRGTKMKDYISRSLALMKAISKNQYISHEELQIEEKQFQDMLESFCSKKMIRKNRLSNRFGANAYDCTLQGEEFLQKKQKEKIEIITSICSAIGSIGAIMSTLR